MGASPVTSRTVWRPSSVNFPWTKETPHQGNRVKDSCCDKAGEEVVIPRGDFAPSC
jgi:hypothetical protein